MAESPEPKITSAPEESLTSAKLGIKTLLGGSTETKTDTEVDTKTSQDPDKSPTTGKDQYSNSQEAIAEVRERIGVHLIEDPEVSDALEAHRQLLMGQGADRTESTESIIERLLAKKAELLAEHERKLSNQRAAKRRAAAKKKASIKKGGVLEERNPYMKGKKLEKFRESLSSRFFRYIADLLKKLELRITGEDPDTDDEILEDLVQPKTRISRKKRRARRKAGEQLTGIYSVDGDGTEEEIVEELEGAPILSESQELSSLEENEALEEKKQSKEPKKQVTQEVEAPSLEDRVEKSEVDLSENRPYEPSGEKRPAPGADPKTEKRMKQLGLIKSFNQNQSD